jgi:uncharacterized protein YjgD (DUF1641 family)
MNNSKIIENTLEQEQEIDVQPMLRARQEKIAKIIEAIDSLAQSNHWKFLEKEIFQGQLDSFVNQLCVEKDDKQVARLQGKIEVLSKYADFKGFSEAYRLELKKIEQQLKGR